MLHLTANRFDRIFGQYAIGCVPQSFWLYGPDSAYPNGIQSMIKVWVFDLDGTRYAIHSEQVESDDEGVRELAEIVDSIRFE